MALGVFAVTQIGRRTTLGDRRCVFMTLTPTDNYETGGLVFTPSMVGLNDFDFVNVTVGMASALSTGLVGAYDAGTGKIVFFESGAANAALAEKSNAEAFPTGFTCKVMAVGH